MLVLVRVKEVWLVSSEAVPEKALEVVWPVTEILLSVAGAAIIRLFSPLA